jgi:putative sigma-54 modulation protein
MRVHVRCTGLPHSQSLVEHTERKVYQHLSRFGGRLTSIEVRLSDVNGPRGGRDKRCQVIARAPGLGSLRVEELHDDLYAGAERALGRLAQAVGRSIARARERYVEAGRRAS